MDPVPASSQNNQNFGKDNLNPKPVNAPGSNDADSIKIKVPPNGILGSKASLNSDGGLKPDKNIKVDLDLNSAPALGADYPKNNAGVSPVPKRQPVQNDFSPAQAQKSDYNNADQYKLSNGEVQGPKPPLVPNKSHKLIFILIAGIAIGALAIGAYYLTQNSGGDISLASVSPQLTPEPTVDPTLDSDSDTIPDAVEKAIGANPDKMDTDGDSFNDLAEIKNGYSPLIAGAAGKYAPEALKSLKDKIKAADEKFYLEVFGVENSPENKETKD